MIDMTEKAKRMAELVREIEDVKRAKRETAKEYREQLKTLWNELETLGGDVESEQMSIGDDGGEDGTTISLKANDGEWTKPLPAKEFNRRVRKAHEALSR